MHEARSPCTDAAFRVVAATVKACAAPGLGFMKPSSRSTCTAAQPAGPALVIAGGWVSTRNTEGAPASTVNVADVVVDDEMPVAEMVYCCARCAFAKNVTPPSAIGTVVVRVVQADVVENATPAGSGTPGVADGVMVPLA